VADLSSISLSVRGIGKKFFRQWAVRNVSFDMQSGEQLLIRGANGSGKSTLLRMIAGQLGPTEGEINFQAEGKNLDQSDWYRYFAWAGPAIDLHADLTMDENVELHFRFKKCLLPSVHDLAGELRLGEQRRKILRDFSSGMLQRLKTGLAVFSHASLLLLDEPTGNLDRENREFIHQIIRTNSASRIIILSSNQDEDFGLYSREIVL